MNKLLTMAVLPFTVMLATPTIAEAHHGHPKHNHCHYHRRAGYSHCHRHGGRHHRVDHYHGRHAHGHRRPHRHRHTTHIVPTFQIWFWVKTPHHYDFVIQPVEFILKNGIPFCEGNVIKYVSRWREKNGREDLLKARHYIDILLESLDSEEQNPYNESI